VLVPVERLPSNSMGSFWTMQTNQLEFHLEPIEKFHKFSYYCWIEFVIPGTPGICGMAPIMLVRADISVGTPGIDGIAPVGAAGMAGMPKLLKPGHPPNCGAPDATIAKVANKQIWKTTEP
jgi:hypothetical protein